MSERFSFPTDTYLLIGRIARAHGLNGEVKITPLSGQPENFYHYVRLALVAEDGRMTALLSLSRVRLQGVQVIVKLDTIDSKAEADLTAGMGVLLLKKDLPEPEPGEFYLYRLEGLRVRTVVPDRVIGTVYSFFSNGAQDIMIVRGTEEEFLIPLVPGIVVGRDEQEIVIDPPSGLLDINAGTDR